MSTTIRHNWHQILVSIDQFLTTLFCSIFFYKEKSYADETLSCRAIRWEEQGVRSWPRKLIDKIFFWEHNHCYSSYISEKERKQLPPELR